MRSISGKGAVEPTQLQLSGTGQLQACWRMAGDAIPRESGGEGEKSACFAYAAVAVIFLDCRRRS